MEGSKGAPRRQFYLPETVSRLAIETRGSAGRAWLGRLPRLIDECAALWSLTVETPFPHLSYNYVIPVTRSDGSALVLKVCFPDDDFLTEAAALKFFDGRGCARLVDFDQKKGAILLERLRPGITLGTVSSDQRATSIAARVMKDLWRPVPPIHSFPAYGDWVLRMSERATEIVRIDPTFPIRWVRHALVLYNELVSSPVELVVLHGDLHRQNVLSAEREDWLAIDPKGVIGEPACEAGPLLIDSLPESRDVEQIRPILASRVRQLADELSIDRERMIAWSIIRAVLAAYWSVESFGRGWKWALLCAEALLVSD